MVSVFLDPDLNRLNHGLPSTFSNNCINQFSLFYFTYCVKMIKTKFIIISHHALTMSRMHRLYGITMPEKGVSQLVAVDLQKAEELVA